MQRETLQDAAPIAAFKFAGGKVLDFVLPPRCASCGALTERQVGLCSACWPGLSFITDPFCERCGVPFEFAVPGRSVCAACLRRPPAFDRAFSPLSYGDMSRTLILQLKHGDRLGHAQLLANLMAPHVASFGLESPLVMPVPLHPWRLIWRRFNQSVLLARHLARTTGHKLDVFSLARRRRTKMQQGLDARQRRENVRAAFMVPAKRRGFVKGRDILLIDDVFTTGATVEACCKPLRKAGARRIGVLTAARVVSPQSAAI
ncbi:MAG: ComF family protein [Pseudomonadota bacterium]